MQVIPVPCFYLFHSYVLEKMIERQINEGFLVNYKTVYIYLFYIVLNNINKIYKTMLNRKYVYGSMEYFLVACFIL